MHLDRFEPAADPEAVRGCHQVYLAGLPDDDPLRPPASLRYFAGWMRLGWTEDPSEAWLARDDDGEIRGWYVLSLPQRENQHLATLNLVVHPAIRRTGWGTALVRHAAQRARHDGRTVLYADTRQDSASSAFACALGARQGGAEVHRVLQIRARSATELAALRATAEPAARGYDLVSWTGPAPEALVAGVAAVNGAEADAPREADVEAQLWDAERVRLDERRHAAQGLRYYTVAARAQASGELAGLTQLGIDPGEPTWGQQELTAVARPHRGHRLGLLLKIVMLELLAEREPQLTRILTGNNDQNQHMIAINEELGFEVLERWPSWEMEVTAALADGLTGRMED